MKYSFTPMEKRIDKVRHYQCDVCSNEMRQNEEQKFTEREMRPCKMSMFTDQMMELDYCIIDGGNDSDWKEV